MSRDDILNMPVGDALDVLIAEKVMGYKFPTVEEMRKEAEKQWEYQPDCRHFLMGFEAWKEDEEFKWRYKTKLYSAMISAAWEVVEKIKTQHDISIHSDNSEKNGYHVMITEYGTVRRLAQVFAETAPLAISRAALLAVME